MTVASILEALGQRVPEPSVRMLRFFRKPFSQLSRSTSSRRELLRGAKDGVIAVLKALNFDSDLLLRSLSLTEALPASKTLQLQARPTTLKPTIATPTPALHPLDPRAGRGVCGGGEQAREADRAQPCALALHDRRL